VDVEEIPPHSWKRS